MPDEPFGRERVFDIPEEPPVRSAPPRRESAPAPAPAPAPSAPAAQSSGNSAIWSELQEHYKGRLPVNHRVFLNMSSGVLNGDCLTVYCSNDFVKTSLDNTTVLTVLREVTSNAVGQPIRVELKVGKAPRTSAAAPVRTAAPAPAPAPRPAPAPKIEETPPWEEPAAPRDPLEELVSPAQKLDGFKIK